MVASDRSHLLQRITKLKAEGFEALAVDIFKYQYAQNPFYRQFVDTLGQQPGTVNRLQEIPFLPIQFFKNHKIQTGSWAAERVFSSSGTTGGQTSRHFLRDQSFYRWTARACFSAFYGDPENYCFLGLLPSYLEREGSSLVSMVQDFIESSKFSQSGFYLDDYAALRQKITACRKEKIPVVLIGVSFALLDLAEQGVPASPDLIVMETGGMKGRRREITREELHSKLKSAFQVDRIHSEYGMTELFSQAYSAGEGLFRPGPTMRVLARDITDPLSWAAPGRTAALNIIDLGNLDTISFVATDDLGKVYADGSFRVLGRLDHSDLRGCNLMLADHHRG